MARKNVHIPAPKVFTHEGAPAARTNSEQELRRSVCACLLWEDDFYENGNDIAARIISLVHKVPAETVSALAIEARERFKLRHVPLLLARELARMQHPLTEDTLAAILKRADEPAEFLALYWANGRQPVTKAVQRGISRAFRQFNEYHLAKYDRGEKIKLRDVLRICHPVPKDEEQSALWKRLKDRNLATPETWEVRLTEAHTSEAKRAVWEDLLNKGKTLGAMALIRNLRNMQKVGVSHKLIVEAMDRMNAERVLPYRFITAARYAPDMEEALERAMFRCIEGTEKLPGHTVVLVDVSGSMESPISSPFSRCSGIVSL